jgi:hypothetical protein
MSLHVVHDFARERQNEMRAEAQLQRRLREADRLRAQRRPADRRAEVERAELKRVPALSQPE